MTFKERLMRFLFAPVSLLGIIMLMNLKKEFYIIEESCEARDICFGYCTLGNYPDLTCVDRILDITYNGNEYKHFFFYPNPNLELGALDARHFNSGNEVVEAELLKINTGVHMDAEDLNNDGKISKEEFKEILIAHADEFKPPIPFS